MPRSDPSPSEHLRAAAQIRALIAQNNLLPGAKLPSELQLSRQWNMDRGVINRAVVHLAATGEIQIQGRRRFVGTGRAPAEPAADPPSVYPVTLLIDEPNPAISSALLRLGTQPSHVKWSDVSAIRTRLLEILAHPPSGFLMWPPIAVPIDDLMAQIHRAGIPFVVYQTEIFPGNSVSTDISVQFRLALQHLLELGHRRIAFVVAEIPGDAYTAAATGAFHRACQDFALPPEAYTTYVTSYVGSLHYHVRQALADLADRTPPVTALVLSQDLAEAALTVARECSVRIPADFSLVALGGLIDSNIAAAGLTSVGVHPAHLGRIGAELLVAQLHERAHTGCLPPPERIRLLPRLAVRHSSAPRNVPRRKMASRPAPPPQPSLDPAARPNLLEVAESRRAHAMRTWRDPYPFAIERRDATWESLPLEPFLNRAVSRVHSWLGGEPLSHLTPGLKLIHGVPFKIPNERANHGRAALVLRSARARSTEGSPLPDSVRIPLPAHAAALFVLHACGWVVDRRPFASYTIQGEGSRTHHIPLVPFSSGPPDPAHRDEWIHSSNIQDWWSGCHQFTNQNARHLIVSDIANPLEYERYLYTLQWINPEPGRPLESLEIQSDPQSEATLGILAITAVW